jgi:hypothetical protein
VGVAVGEGAATVLFAVSQGVVWFLELEEDFVFGGYGEVLLFDFVAYAVVEGY